jgi:PmbA protein
MDLNAVRQSLEAAAADAVERARKLGADQAEVGASIDEGLTVTVRMGELESVERQRDRSLGVTVYKDGRKGSASTAKLSADAVAEAVEKAISIARFTAPDPCAGLADADRMASDPPDLDLYHPWPLEVDDAAALARRAEDAARAVDARIDNSEGATLSTGGGLRVYANTHGFLAGYPASSHSVSVSVVARDGSALERDYWYDVARWPQGLQTPEQIGEQAGRRAAGRLGARRLKTRVMPVLFPAEHARGLLGHMVAAIRGTSQYRKASFLLAAAGERIFPDFVNINEDPFIARGMASAPYDAEGVRTQQRALVSDGVLQGYVLSSYSARRLGLETTGNAGGIHNLTVTPAVGDPMELVADMDEVFVVGELLGHGANTVTGDYSRGAAGFLFGKGELRYPVSEVTVAGNLRDMLGQIRAIGADIDNRGAIRCGSILVDGLTVAGE